MQSSDSKPNLSFWQIWNMSFGFLGIQFGWGLQMANMSAIYKFLGAENHQIPLLWLAAPMTGLLVQPFIGYLSDRTWNAFGRRKPYFLIGALLSSLCLVLMPNSSALWMAAGLLWILDASINISMEPFRAFVSDLLPEKQLTKGFTMQSFFIGLGAVIASAMPWIFTHWFGFDNDPSKGIPDSVRYSFYIGAAVFFFAILYTVFTTKEYPPDPQTLQSLKENKIGWIQGFKEILQNIRNMPIVMRKLARVQFFTWMGLFLMWFHYSDAVAIHFFKAVSNQDPEYIRGIEYAGLMFALYSLVTFLFSFGLKSLAEHIGKIKAHQYCLWAGGLGLLSMLLHRQPDLLFIGMVGVGIAWTSTLSMPYAIFAPHLPEGKSGVYMGIFNFFIVLPEILAALFFGWVMKHIFHQNTLYAVAAGGCMFLLAGCLCYFVDDQKNQHP